MTVREAVSGDVPALVETLVAAFSEDPVSLWMIPPRGFPERTAPLYRLMLDHALADGHVWTVDDLSSVALIAPPGRWKVPPGALVRGLPGLLRAGGTRLPRMLGRLFAVEKLHPTAPPHYYVSALGTRPDRHGQGLGSALLEHLTDRCDAEGVPAYLESSNPRNLTLYRRHGFEVTGSPQFRQGPPQWLLWRECATTR